MVKCDFSGYATRNDLQCADGRTIRKNAFAGNDGQKVPLVWNHQHSEAKNVLGHALLENREDGVYAYCTFNDTENGREAKELVRHGDISSLSIYANQLKEMGGNVIHGAIRELSLVLAGANPGAYIDFVMAHGENGEELSGFEACYNENLMLYHSAETDEEDKEKQENQENQDQDKEDKDVDGDNKETELEHTDQTVGDVFSSLTEDQKTVVYAMIGQALEDAGNNEDGGDEEMKHNLFENETQQDSNVLSHDAMNAIIGDAKRYGSLKDSFLAHAEDYGIDSIDWLFPEATNLNTPPEFIKRDTGWVTKVMSGTHHSPFSRIKSMFADITEDEARAKGYIKGKLKKEEVFSLLKRTTTPTTIYKKQKLDRDDVVDITDFDVVAWLKSEMRIMLDEEIARAILIGDGRLASSDDKINESNIRPIYNDAELYTIQCPVKVASDAGDDDKANAFITAAIKSRKNYKGSGNPSLYTTEDVVTDCLLLKDVNGRFIYTSVEELAKVLRVKEIITVEVMETAKGKNGGDLLGIIVNLADYNVGADKGGAVNMFDDFDIDYNQQKYLIETRCSGALTKPYSAIAFEVETASPTQG